MMSECCITQTVSLHSFCNIAHALHLQAVSSHHDQRLSATPLAVFPAVDPLTLSPTSSFDTSNGFCCFLTLHLCTLLLLFAPCEGSKI